MVVYVLLIVSNFSYDRPTSLSYWVLTDRLCILSNVVRSNGTFMIMLLSCFHVHFRFQQLSCTWLTVYIEIAITADCKLLPWQQMQMLCKYLLSSCVAKVTGHVCTRKVVYKLSGSSVGVVIRVAMAIPWPTPICKMTILFTECCAYDL